MSKKYDAEKLNEALKPYGIEVILPFPVNVEQDENGRFIVSDDITCEYYDDDDIDVAFSQYAWMLRDHYDFIIERCGNKPEPYHIAAVEKLRKYFKLLKS